MGLADILPYLRPKEARKNTPSPDVDLQESHSSSLESPSHEDLKSRDETAALTPSVERAFPPSFEGEDGEGNGSTTVEDVGSSLESTVDRVVYTRMDHGKSEPLR